MTAELQDMFDKLRPLQTATLAARVRLNDQTIGTHVSRGLYQVIRVTYAKSGKSTVTPVSAWLPLSAVITALENM